MYYEFFLHQIKELIDQINVSQGDVIQVVASRCADAITAERWVHLFGSGHSSIPVMEAFPRIGSYVGFHPLNELNLSFNSQVLGGMAQRQASFLEHIEGYAGAIMANYKFSPLDVIIIFSHSGINELVVDMALIGKEKGMSVVGITSIQHSKHNDARHSSGLRLFEVADYVIDTCAPEGDAIVDVEGLDYSVAGCSTILSCIIMNALVAQIASELVKRNYMPTIWPSHNISSTSTKTEEVIYTSDNRVRITKPPDNKIAHCSLYSNFNLGCFLWRL
jgi:uncharacterized phosphosugar-binding protein